MPIFLVAINHNPPALIPFVVRRDGDVPLLATLLKDQDGEWSAPSLRDVVINHSACHGPSNQWRDHLVIDILQLLLVSHRPPRQTQRTGR